MTVDGNTIYLSFDDAWAGNIAFWYTLLYTMYGNKVSMTYTCEEPGMGYYYSNDPYELETHEMYASTTDINVINNIPAAWKDTGNPLFRELNLDNPCVSISPDRYRGFMGMNGTFYQGRGVPVSYEMNVSGLYDDVKEYVEKYFFDRAQPIATLENCRDMMSNVADDDADWYPELRSYEPSDPITEVKQEFISEICWKEGCTNKSDLGEVKEYDFNLLDKKVKEYSEMTGVELYDDYAVWKAEAQSKIKAKNA